MKRTMKKEKLLPIVAFAIVLSLASSLEIVYASAAIDEQYSLPDFLLRLSEYLSKGNASELARIRNQMIKQEMLKRERIRETNGAVLKPPDSLLDDTYLYMDEITGVSPDQYDIYNNLIGHVVDAGNLVGQPDGYGALLEAFDWNHDYSNPIGGEACINGRLSGWTWEGADVYVKAKIGPSSESVPPWFNYLIVWTSYDIGETWDYVGYISVSGESFYDFYVGYSPYTFHAIAIASWTPPQWPIPYEPEIKNSALVDSVYTVEYE